MTDDLARASVAAMEIVVRRRLGINAIVGSNGPGWRVFGTIRGYLCEVVRWCHDPLMLHQELVAAIDEFDTTASIKEQGSAGVDR